MIGSGRGRLASPGWEYSAKFFIIAVVVIMWMICGEV